MARVLLVHRYFHPDVPTYAQMLRFIGAELAATGDDVSVFCGPPTYNGVYRGPALPARQQVDGMTVHRVGLPPDRKGNPALRASSMLVFAVRLVLHVVGHRRDYDLITVTTIPPVVMGVAARVIRRLTGVPYVYHCMDLYPEVAEIAGLVRSPVLTRLARRVDATTCRRAAVVVVLSEDMRETLRRRGLATDNVVVLNNFEVAETPAAPRSDGPRDRFTVLFAGNMGRFQGLENLVEVAHRLADDHPETEFVFMGAGASVADLRHRAGPLLGTTIRFVDHQPVQQAFEAMAASDLAIVSLRPRVHEVAYPSKTAMYLAAGCRVLAVVEGDSDLARLVVGEDIGATCPPDDVDRLEEALRREIGRGPSSLAERERTAEVGRTQFGRAAKLAQWRDLVTGIGASRG